MHETRKPIPPDRKSVKNSFPDPTSLEVEDFFLRLYFGSTKPYFSAAIARAYLDFCRTLRGIGKLPNSKELHAQASDLVESGLLKLPDLEPSQQDYDFWHKDLCSRIVDKYQRGGYPLVSIGHAQKWVNMAVKYSVLLGDRCVIGIANVFPHAHVPVDSIMLYAFAKLGLPRPMRFFPWSKIQSYSLYMEFQEWIRERFPNSAPLSVEFHLWQKGVSKESKPGAT